MINDNSIRSVSFMDTSIRSVTFGGRIEEHGVVILDNSTTENSLSDDDLIRQEEGRPRARPAMERLSSSFSNSAHLRMSRSNLDVDEDILHRAAADAGLGSMGTVYVEVWTLSQDGTKLSRPDGGYWMDPVFHNPETEDCGCCRTLQCSACRVSNPDHPRFIPADPVAPGVGLAGVLWSESVSVEDTATAGGILKEASTKRKVVWRDVQAMANNPHLPFDERLHAIAKCGLGWAAGVPFHVNNHKGIVIYVARKTVDHALLTESGNLMYLTCAADLIGSAWALREPRRLAMASRKAKREAAIRRARIKLLFMIRMGWKFDQPLRQEETKNGKGFKTFEEEPPSAVQVIKEKATVAVQAVATVAKKCKGSNNKPPPPFSTEQAVFTFMGSFFLLTFLAFIGHIMVTNHGQDFMLLMPPFGAFICLQFALTQAPAAQPRNCLVGQLLSISIGLTISFLPLLPAWFKPALGTSIAIAVMSRCGVTHPPAGASAFLFSSGLFGITHFALLLGGNVLAILLGSVINNMSEKRQYPTYYALGLNPKDMIAYLKR